MSTTATAPANAGSVRQPTRQTRTNPSRTSKAAGRSLAAQNSQAIFGGSHGVAAAADHAQAPHVPHGFYPAITHFTDAILALPREVRRHTSLLKEVDAKAWALEENLQTLLNTTSGSQPVKAGSQLTAAASDGASVASQDQQGQPGEAQDATSRRRMFYDLRCTLSEIMFTSDEKNHVLVNANDELQRQLGRLDAVFPYVEGEVSDEARLGSTSHWAYSSEDPKGKKKNGGPSGNERTRREVAAANQAGQEDAATRSETRRQAVNTRKNKRTHADLDFDDGRPPTTAGASRKTTSGGKNQRATDTPDRAANSAANTAAATPAPAKRRKVEKQPQTLAGTTESTPNTAATPAEAKDASAPDVAPKKRTRAPPNPAGRKRNNTATSNTGPPSAISSPVIGTFNAPRNAASPAPSATNRPQSSRTQNTAQTQNGRQRPQSSTSNRATANTQKSTPTELPKSTLKEAASAKTESIAVAAGVKDSDIHADSSVTATPADIPPKREETPNVTSNPPNIVTAPVPTSAAERQPSVPKGRSKTSTPVTATFSDSSGQQTQQQTSQPQRSRPTRATEAPPKRSHKKGASQALAAQQQAVASVAASSAAALAEDDESSRLEEDEEEDGDEPRYCYCNQVSFGEMVACDNDTCPREWFHLSCVGLTKPPLKSAKWYCNECKDNMRRGNRGNGR
ncbi:hypothetical protein FQN54_005773 [Arachnomyces sp. PD_36]|nr:hypothetical protein FQN54_005773 [Arachnomyces sp. PD_36]